MGYHRNAAKDPARSIDQRLRQRDGPSGYELLRTRAALRKNVDGAQARAGTGT